MPSITRTALYGVVGLCIALGVGLYYQHNKIATQAATIAVQKDSLEKLDKDRKGQEAADAVKTAKVASLQKQLTKAKGDLSDALKNEPCASTALPDSAVSVLNQLYVN